MAGNESPCPRCGRLRDADEPACADCGQMPGLSSTARPPLLEVATYVFGLVAGVAVGLAYWLAIVSALSTLSQTAPYLRIALLAAAQIGPFGLCFYFAVRELRRGSRLGVFLVAFGVAALLPTVACDAVFR